MEIPMPQSRGERPPASQTITGSGGELHQQAVGGITTAQGKALAAHHAIEGAPSVLFDAVAILPSTQGGKKLATSPAAVNFLRDAYAHLKVIAYVAASEPIFDRGGLADAFAAPDAGSIALHKVAPSAFIAAAEKGRIWARASKVTMAP